MYYSKPLEEEICKPKVEFSGEVDESVYMSTMDTLEPQVDTKNRHESKDAKESALHQSLDVRLFSVNLLNCVTRHRTPPR